MLVNKLSVVVFTLMMSFQLWATEETYQFETDAQREAFQSLTLALRCPMCQNQNIADSDAMIAQDMRRKVYQLLKQGKSEQEIIEYMKSRYGDFIYYRPPLTPLTLWLWLLPALFAVGGFVFVVKRKQLQEPEDREAKLAKAEALLRQEQGNS